MTALCTHQLLSHLVIGLIERTLCCSFDYRYDSGPVNGNVSKTNAPLSLGRKVILYKTPLGVSSLHALVPNQATQRYHAVVSLVAVPVDHDSKW